VAAEVEYRALYEHGDGEPTVQPIPAFAVDAYRERGWRIEQRDVGEWGPADA
jgi:hypothetical protein